jgi:HEPN domain-containing protein
MKDRAELCAGLLRKARNDGIAMEASLAAGALDSACFHAQQMVEKSLKAYLAPLRRYVPIHSQPYEAG